VRDALGAHTAKAIAHRVRSCECQERGYSRFSSRVDDSIGKIEQKLHRAATARGIVLREYFDTANRLDHLPNSCFEAKQP